MNDEDDDFDVLQTAPYLLMVSILTFMLFFLFDI